MVDAPNAPVNGHSLPSAQYSTAAMIKITTRLISADIIAISSGSPASLLLYLRLRLQREIRPDHLGGDLALLIAVDPARDSVLRGNPRHRVGTGLQLLLRHDL